MDTQIKKNKVVTNPWKAVDGYSMMTVQMDIQGQVEQDPVQSGLVEDATAHRTAAGLDDL